MAAAVHGNRKRDDAGKKQQRHGAEFEGVGETPWHGIPWVAGDGPCDVALQALRRANAQTSIMEAHHYFVRGDLGRNPGRNPGGNPGGNPGRVVAQRPF